LRALGAALLLLLAHPAQAQGPDACADFLDFTWAWMEGASGIQGEAQSEDVETTRPWTADGKASVTQGASIQPTRQRSRKLGPISLVLMENLRMPGVRYAQYVLNSRTSSIELDSACHIVRMSMYTGTEWRTFSAEACRQAILDSRLLSASDMYPGNPAQAFAAKTQEGKTREPFEADQKSYQAACRILKSAMFGFSSQVAATGAPEATTAPAPAR
jgi:hypothetical protein